MQECNDKKCFNHGHVKVRGNVFTGRVLSAKQEKTATVEREITHFVPKYERYKKVRSRIKVHNPKCINAREGDLVRIGETRKLSKTKSFVIMNVESKAGEKTVEKDSVVEKGEKAGKKRELEKQKENKK